MQASTEQGTLPVHANEQIALAVALRRNVGYSDGVFGRDRGTYRGHGSGRVSQATRRSPAFISPTSGVVPLFSRVFAGYGINVTASDAVTAGKGRYGMLLWVKPKDFARAAKTLDAK